MLTLTRPTPEHEQLAPALAPVTGGLAALHPPDIEAGLTAIGDREDIASTDERARLRRVRAALEDELARHLRS